MKKDKEQFLKTGIGKILLKSWIRIRIFMLGDWCIEKMRSQKWSNNYRIKWEKSWNNAHSNHIWKITQLLSDLIIHYHRKCQYLFLCIKLALLFNYGVLALAPISYINKSK